MDGLLHVADDGLSGRALGWSGKPLRIAIVTDAWAPQTNGVVRTLSFLAYELRALGHEPLLITPEHFFTVPLPTYSEIRLALATQSQVGRQIDAAGPDAIHIVTEGPLGLAARRYCLRRKLAFTTSFHTKFPDYIEARFGIPARWSYRVLRRFHNAAAVTMVATPSVHRELESHGFKKLRRWTRGVDLDHFRPAPKAAAPWPSPIFLYVGRIAVEKNLSAFLSLDLPGTKLIVGEGPQRAELEKTYAQACFLGGLYGQDLAAVYALADVFVFPSRTDTFGLVMLEALASGIPVAGYPVPGPLDLIGTSGAGVLDRDLRKAALAALGIDPAICRARAGEFTWRNSARQFLDNLHLVRET